MSQLSARSEIFLDEMGVGPQWKLRQRLPSMSDGAAVDSAVGPAEVDAEATPAPVAAEVVHASALADVPAPLARPVEPLPAMRHDAHLASGEAQATPHERPAPGEASAVPAAALDTAAVATVRHEHAPAVEAPVARAAPDDDVNNSNSDSHADDTAWFDDAPAPSRPAPVSDESIAAMDWPALKSAIASCTRCALCATRRATVQGRGQARAEWLAIGAAPSRLDEKEGRAVAGEPGQLLDNMLKAIALSTESNVYLTNLVKCRPAGADGAERAASADEVAACRPYLLRELELTGAAMAITFGQAAARGLLGMASRGKVHRHGALPVVATYHPDDLLRKPEDKAKAWADLCLARTARDNAA